MIRLFWGLFFVLLDYKVTVGTAVIEILPDVLGFYLLMKGMEAMAGESRCFDLGRHWAFAMSLISGVLFLADLMNADTMMRVWLWAAELAALVICLCILKMIVTGLQEMGKSGVETIGSLWLILAVLLPLCRLLSWVPVVGTVSNWAANLASGLFLLAFYRSIRRSAA